MAEMEELKGDSTKSAEGFILESHLDPKKGICATLIITDGTVKSGSFVVSEDKISPTRIMENFLGRSIKEATFSSPISIIGFKEAPTVGSTFMTTSSKKEAEKLVSKFKPETVKPVQTSTQSADNKIIPLVIKADVLGSIEAIEKELAKIDTKKANVKLVNAGVGDVSENDVLVTGNDKKAIIVGFNVGVDASAKDLAERAGIDIETFDIIYKLTEWLEEKIIEKTPKEKVEKIIGTAKVLRIFNKTKNKQVIGGEVKEGSISVGAKLRILRRENEIDKGKIVGMETQKEEVKEVKEGQQFGAMIEAKQDIAEKDRLEAFIITEE